MRLPEHVRAALSLTRFQAIVGITAGLVSIGVTAYSFLYLTVAPRTGGELVAIVREARTGRPVPDATIEVLTPKDALVTTLTPKDGQARQALKEGVYKLRVSHPRFATEVRQVHVLAGQSAEIRLRLAPRPEKESPLDALKKIFR
jgi:hypothetical protein